MPRTTVYAVRDSDTKERISYRYRKQSEVIGTVLPSIRAAYPRRNLEMYKTTQDLPRQRKAR